MKPLTRILRTDLVDGSVVQTIYLGVPAIGPESPLEALVHDENTCEVQQGEVFQFETAITQDGDDWRVLRRHKTMAEAITWHEDYLDKVIPK